MTSRTFAAVMLAAALAGIQSFFNFQKVVECHTKSGGVYGSINHRLNLIIAEYEEAKAFSDLLEDWR